MTAAPPLAYPSSRVLASWWRSLAGRRPRALWVGHLFFHHVEALARVRRHHPLDRLHQLALRALAQAPDRTPAGLDRRLHLGAPVLRRLLCGLAERRLAGPGPGGDWSPTALGLHALEQGACHDETLERLSFHFLDRLGPAPAPHYVKLSPAACSPWSPPQDWEFDPAVLQSCVDRPPEWKQRHDFPPQVVQVLTLPPGWEPAGETEAGENHDAAAGWRRVVLDRPERLLAAVVRVAAESGGERLIGFAVRPEGWVLAAEAPVFTLPDDRPGTFADLTEEPPLESWRQGWRGWCQQRNLPGQEAEACRLERCEYRLRVVAPRRLVDRLQAVNSDAVKGEAWVLAGTGPLRHAALVEVVEGADRPDPVERAAV